MSHLNKKSILAWFLVLLVVVLSLVQHVLDRSAVANNTIGGWLLYLVSSLLPAFILSGVGALIISKQSGNRIGWLLIIAALGGSGPSTDLVLAGFPEGPAVLTPKLWLLIWFDNWSWVIFIFPLFLIPLNFPDGNPPGPRWQWVNRLAAGMVIFLIFELAFLKEIGPMNESWQISNPIGFIPSGFIEGPFIFFWALGLLTVVGGSVASLFARYRRAGQVERDQIKWMLFGGALFFLLYCLIIAAVGIGGAWFGEAWTDTALTLAVLALPITIAIAILRHRLYDINVIIRRTLQYSLVTVFLTAIYFGVVIILQNIFSVLTGDTNTPLITVISTLTIAALFNSIRSRLQDWIDRRFYRSKYDAERALSEFASKVRDEVDLNRLALSILEVAGTTLQPNRASLHLRVGPRDRFDSDIS